MMPARAPSSRHLSPALRIATGLQILRCGLCPIVSKTLTAADRPPLDGLPASSPVRKQGFLLDARGALQILRQNADLFCSEAHTRPFLANCRSLLKYRDLWAHQQPLSHTEADGFLSDAATLLGTLERHVEARAIMDFMHPSEDLQTELDWIFDQPDAESTMLLTELCDALTLDDFPEDLNRLRKALTQQAAQALPFGELPYALRILSAETPISTSGHRPLPGQAFWWCLGLPHDAVNEDVKTAWQSAMLALDGEP